MRVQQSGADSVRRVCAPKPKERDINNAIRDLLTLDSWHVFLMEPISRKEWGKGTGEIGEPDILALRYQPDVILWIEGKTPKGKPTKQQLAWHAAERARGALTLIAGVDFPASVEGFWNGWYRSSGLMRKDIKVK